MIQITTKTHSFSSWFTPKPLKKFPSKSIHSLVNNTAARQTNRHTFIYNFIYFHFYLNILHAYNSTTATDWLLPLSDHQAVHSPQEDPDP